MAPGDGLSLTVYFDLSYLESISHVRELPLTSEEAFLSQTPHKLLTLNFNWTLKALVRQGAQQSPGTLDVHWNVLLNKR